MSNEIVRRRPFIVPLARLGELIDEAALIREIEEEDKILAELGEDAPSPKPPETDLERLKADLRARRRIQNG
jgi:hypothetical protein